MITKVLNTIQKYGMAENCRVLVALSGGADSSVLLDVLLKLKSELSISVCAAHLNHMLRGDEADSDEAFAREKCKALGVDFISERADIRTLARESGESEELCARRVRYDFLERARIALGADVIATAHNANDNLETMLFNLARGSGTDGLCGIPPIRGKIIRPLIACTREEIESYSENENVTFCTDRTNNETVYSRNKIRHKVIPPLLEMNNSVFENALRTSHILRSEAEFLKCAAEKLADEISCGENACSAEGLLGEPALILRVCEIFCARALGEVSYSLEFCHAELIKKLAESKSPSAKISLPKSLCAKRCYEKIIFEKDRETQDFSSVCLTEGEHDFGNYSISVKKLPQKEKINNLLNTFFVPCDKINGNLVIRTRRVGDEIKLSGRKTKTLKRLFIDEKFPREKRDSLAVIADDEKVFGVSGFGSDSRFSSDSSCGYFIEIKEK